MYQHFLSLLDIGSVELDELFTVTDRLKHDHSWRPLHGKGVTLIFQKPSLRTRVSFEIGVSQLGGHAVVLSQEGIGIGSREPASDVAHVLADYSDMIVARLFEHSTLLELAANSSVPVINALTDLSHPCQVLADLYTLRCQGRLYPGIKVAFIGDGNNVVNSWLEMAALYPMHFVLAAPEGYEPDATILQAAVDAGISTIEVTDDPAAAAYGADVIYTDVWTSMGQETEAEIRRKVFAPYQVNAKLVALADSNCAVMHCLPAHRGEEITSDVFDRSQGIIFEQAKNRLHVQKGVMARLAEHRRTEHITTHQRRRVIALQ